MAEVARVGTVFELSALRRKPFVSPFCVKDAERLGGLWRGYLRTENADLH